MFAVMHQFWQENHQFIIRKNDEPVQFALVKAEEPKA